jgi:flagellar motility protein MotE (MotC chaperone)
MDHDTLDRMRQSHPAWRLLNAEHAPLVLSFLILAFVQPNRRAILAPELTASLDAYLDQLRESYPQRYPRSAREYLEDWAGPGRAFLRKYYPKSGQDAEFDLTPATEKAIEWLQTLAPQQFVGTESRLLTLFQLLRDLAAGAQDDPTARIRELERRRAEIDREIERVREGRAGPLDATQVKERYAQLSDVARRLLADFRQVEENFRMLDTQTRERIATSMQPKGALLDSIFGETDHIHRSDQGKSFEAFWEFLMSPARQDELRNGLRAVHALDAVRELGHEDYVRNIPSLLLDAGEKVHATVAQLVDQLRRFVDEQAHLENRRILDLIHDIETHATAPRRRTSSW